MTVQSQDDTNNGVQQQVPDQSGNQDLSQDNNDVINQNDEGQQNNQDVIQSGTNEFDQDKAKSLYQDLVSDLGQSYIDRIHDRYERVNNILEDRDSLSKLTKEEIIGLYQAKSELEGKLQRIIPVVEQRRRQELESQFVGIESIEARNYLKEVTEGLSLEETSALVGVIKGLMEKMGSQNQNSTGQVQKPANLKGVASGGSSSGGQQIDPVKGMFDPDPKVREQAAKGFDDLLMNIVKTNGL